MNRPHTTVVLAMSADGKISDADRHAVNFGSEEDYARLEGQVALADGVVFGAGTLRSGGTAMTVQSQKLIDQRVDQGQRPQPIQIVCSRSGDISTGLKFFQQSVPRWLFTTPDGAQPWQGSDHFDAVLAYAQESNTNELDWACFFDACLEANIQKLAILGGGGVVGSLLEQDYLDELHLTLCPVLIGGKNAPTPAEGNGLNQDLAPRLSLLNCEQVDNELFLHYKVLRSEQSRGRTS